MAGYTLYHSKGCGSACVQVMLEMAGAPYETLGNEEIKKINPLSQVPTLILPSGEVLTESAAIVLHLIEKFPEANLAPPPGTDERARFYRWLVYVAANVYAAVVVGDHPERWVRAANCSELEEGSIRMRKRSWQILEQQLTPGPYLLGAKMTALDFYVGMMTYWRPRRKWFEENCKKLMSAVRETEKHPVVQAVWARNFT